MKLPHLLFLFRSGAVWWLKLFYVCLRDLFSA